MLDRGTRDILNGLSLVNAHVVPVEIPGEVVAIIDDKLPSPNMELTANQEILRQIRDWIWLQHARVGTHTVLLVQFSTLEEHWSIPTAGVPRVRLVNLHSVVGQIVVNDSISSGAVEGGVIPVCLEPQYLTVILEELCQSSPLRWHSQ